MTATDKLEKLAGMCACGVYVTINENRDDYRGVADFMETRASLCSAEVEDIVDADTLAVMVSKDCIVEVQFYPITPTGSYSVYHHDLNAALDRALEIMDSGQ